MLCARSCQAQIIVPPESGMPESTALVRRNVLGLVALDFVLRVIFRRMMRMTFVIEIAGMNPDDRARYPSRLRIPAHVIADFESLGHITTISRPMLDATLQQNCQ